MPRGGKRDWCSRAFRDALIAGFLALSVGWFRAGCDWCSGGRGRTVPPQMRFFLLGWNAAAVLSMGWVWCTATLTRPV